MKTDVERREREKLKRQTQPGVCKASLAPGSNLKGGSVLRGWRGPGGYQRALTAPLSLASMAMPELWRKHEGIRGCGKELNWMGLTSFGFLAEAKQRSIYSPSIAKQQQQKKKGKKK